MPYPCLTFHGAACSVIGFCFPWESDHGDILIDCALFQGAKADKELNFRPIPFAPEKAAAVILSLAHIDLDLSASTVLRLSQTSPLNGSLVFASVSTTVSFGPGASMAKQSLGAESRPMQLRGCYGSVGRKRTFAIVCFKCLESTFCTAFALRRAFARE